MDKVRRQSVFIDTSSVSHSSGRPRAVSGNAVTGSAERVATELIFIKANFATTGTREPAD